MTDHAASSSAVRSAPDASAGAEPGWDDMVTHVLWRAQNAVHRLVQESLGELGVTATQLGLAVHLEQLGPLSAADLSRGFHIAPQSIGTALGRLERLGWVARCPHPVHRRVVLYELTSDGVEGSARGRALMAAINEAVAAQIDEADLACMTATLRAITVTIDGPDSPIAPLWPIAP